MYWDVISVQPDAPYQLSVVFSDGTKGRVRFLPSHFTGALAPLKDTDFFEKVFIEEGALTWPGEIDLAPDALYSEIKEKGEWLLS